MKRKLLYSKKADELYGAFIATTKDSLVSYYFTCDTAEVNWKDHYKWDDTVEVVDLTEGEYTVQKKPKSKRYMEEIRWFENKPQIKTNDKTITRIREWAEQNLPLLKRNEDKGEAGSSKIS